MTSVGVSHQITAPFRADLTRVTISRRIEVDYKDRAVFHQLRRHIDHEWSSLSSVHWCTPEEVAALIQDAHERRQRVKGVLQAAYTNYLKALREAEKDSQRYRDGLSGTEPFGESVCLDSRRVYVVPPQFDKVDLPEDLKLPGSPGGPPKRASYRDREGRLCFVTRAFYLHPQAYQVTIIFSKEEARERLAKYEAEREAARKLPKYASAEDYRDKKAHFFSALALAGLPSKEDNCDFTFEPSVLEAVRQRVQEAECLLRSARVVKLETRGAASPTSASLPAAARPSALRLVHSATGTTS